MSSFSLKEKRFPAPSRADFVDYLLNTEKREKEGGKANKHRKGKRKRKDRESYQQGWLVKKGGAVAGNRKPFVSPARFM